MYVGPDIVDDGLVFAIDAGSTRSYINPVTTVNNLIDSSTATLYNGVAFGTANGGRWDFDGSDDYGVLPNSAIPAGNEITIAFWTEIDTVQNCSIIAGTVNSSVQNLSIHLPWGDGNVYWDCGTIFQRIAYTPTTAEKTGWHNWVFTLNASTGIMKIYLDGVSKQTGAGKTSAVPTMGTVSLARFYTGLYYYNGKIANTLIYNTALTQAEITQNFNAQRTRFGL